MKINERERSEIEIYIHIPFCVRKCQYCDFLSFTAPETLREQYVSELCKEISSWKTKDQVVVSTVFLGGGTPSLLTEDQFEQIFMTLKNHYCFSADVEITIEANPGTVSERKLSCLKNLGVNRISFGLQSTDNRELACLGRIHTYEEFQESFCLARKAGFENINVDLMSALPGQSLESWMDSLEKIAELEPEHISAYSLIIEEGTPFYDKYYEDELLREKGEACKYLPDEETERKMYQVTKEVLQRYGYERYEISNYAKPGRECRHNCGYWTRKEYKGFGLGAASLVSEKRYKNTSDMKKYLKGNWEEEEELLERSEQIEETMFLGLRMMEGVSEEKFLKCYGIPMKSIYKDVIDSMESAGLLEEKDGFIRLSEEGISLSNYVMAAFLRNY